MLFYFWPIFHPKLLRVHAFYVLILSSTDNGVFSAFLSASFP